MNEHAHGRAMKDRRGGAAAATGFPSSSSSSIGCISHSALSVADVLDVYKKQPQPQPQPHATVLPSSTAAAAATPKAAAAAGGAEERGSGDEEKRAVAAPALGIVAAGVQRLIKGIKSLTHIFAAGYDGDEEEEEDEEIVIGFPTDVLHVGHIGWDGGRLSKAGGMGMAGSAFSQLPSSLQLEIAAMEASSHASTPSI